MVAVERLVVLVGLLLISGCYLGSREPFFADAEALAVLPMANEGYSDIDDETKRVGLLRESRTSNTWRLYFPDEGGTPKNGAQVRLFDIGAPDNFFGAQVVLPGDPMGIYVVVRLRTEKTVQIDVYGLGLDAAALKSAGVGFSGSDDRGIFFDTRADLMLAIRTARQSDSLVEPKTIRSFPGGWKNGPPMKSGFDTEGFREGDLLSRIYSGATGGIEAGDYGHYLLEFATVIAQTKNDRACASLLSGAAQAALSILGTKQALENVFGDLAQTQQNKQGGRDQALKEGLEGGARMAMGLVAVTIAAQQDARLFYRRHTCTSKTTRMFYRNLNAFVTGR
tara:strand:- start:313 stop:1323 length:1011 start_codon:yes stop_codon:yes gene_type:complete